MRKLTHSLLKAGINDITTLATATKIERAIRNVKTKIIFSFSFCSVD